MISGLGIALALVGAGAGYSQASKPELFPLSMTLSPPSPVDQGQRVTLSAVIANSGDAVGEVPVEFTLRRKPKTGGPEERWLKLSLVTIKGLRKGDQLTAQAELETAKLEPAVYEIRVAVDPQDQIPEQDETNNELRTPLTVRAASPSIDLQPLGIHFDGPRLPAGPGDRIRLSAEIANLGDSPAGPFSVQFVRRGPADTADVPIGEEVPFSFDGVGLKPHERKETREVQDVEFDTDGLPPGVYLIKVVVDPASADKPRGQVEELNENNNELTAQMTLQAVVDLRPRGIAFKPSEPTTADQIAVTVRVEKTPEDQAVGEFSVAFLVNGLEFARSRVTALPRGQQFAEVSATLNAPTLGLTAGAHRITVVVDAGQQVPEQDEANNQLLATLVLRPAPPRLPELLPQLLRINPPSPVELGKIQNLFVITEIANARTARATAEFVPIEISYRATGRLRWIPISCIVPAACAARGIAPGSFAELKAELPLIDLQAGNYELRVLVDPDNVVPELDEENNELRIAFTLLPPRLPDLQLSRVSIDPLTLELRRGQPVRVTADILNAGDADAPAFRVDFIYRRADALQFTVFKSQELAALGIGQRATAVGVLETANLRPGIYELGVIVDPDSRVPDLDRRNNRFATGVGPGTQPLLLRGPDLLAVSLQPARRLLQPGERLTLGQGEVAEFVLEVANNGAEAAGAFKVSFRHRAVGQPDRSDFGTAAFPGLGAGVTATARAKLDTSGLSPGIYEIMGEVDPVSTGKPFGDVEEEVEENNQIALLIQVIGKPDLMPQRLQLQPVTGVVTQGEPVRVTVEVVNRGRATAPEFQVEFGLCARARAAACEPQDFTPVSIQSFRSLRVDEAVTVSTELATEQLIPGEYIVRVVVDRPGQVDELDKTNNAATASLLILAQPDLEVRNPLLIPAPPVIQGQVLRALAELVNRGPGPVRRPFKVEFALRRIAEREPTLFVPVVVQTVAGIEANQAALVSAEIDTAKLAAGNYELRITADSANEVNEQNEKNNQLIVPFAIVGKDGPPGALPDLLVRELRVDPESVVAGEMVTIVADIVNAGTKSAGPFRVDFFYRRVSTPTLVRIAKFEIAQLEPGARQTLTATLDTAIPSRGTYEIVVMIDVDNRVEENNELNNTAIKTLTIR